MFTTEDHKIYLLPQKHIVLSHTVIITITIIIINDMHYGTQLSQYNTNSYLCCIFIIIVIIVTFNYF